MSRYCGLLFLLGILSCQGESPESCLAGSWRASGLVVQDSTWDVFLEPVRLHLDSTGMYSLEWYRGVQENGTYRTDGNHLRIRPATGGKELLDIIHCSKDSLVLAGVLQSRPSRITFVRQ